jgi:hypothetical protein
MPKKKVVSLLEFLEFGTFGGFELGSSVKDFVSQFGKPLHAKESYETGHLIYEDVDIYTDLKTQQVWGVFIWGFRNSDNLGGFPLENKKFRIDPWLLRYELGLEKTKEALDSANLKYKQIPAHLGNEFETLQLTSGTEIVLAEENIANSQNNRPKNLVYEVIFKFGRKLLSEVGNV